MKKTLALFFSVVIMLTVAVSAFSAQGASSQSNKSQVFSYLTKEIGFNTAAACGVMANMEHESGFDSTKVLYDSNGLLSGGLCMWNGGRFSSLQRFCNENGYNYLSVYGQLKYLEHELKSSYYRHIYNYLKSVSNNQNGAYNAAYYWCYYFEIPANRSYHANKRGGAASSKYWNEYSSFTAKPQTPTLKSSASGKTVDIGSNVSFAWTSGGETATQYIFLLAKAQDGKFDFSKATKYKTTQRKISVNIAESGNYAARVYSVNGFTGEKSDLSSAVVFKSKCLKHSNKIIGSKEPTFIVPGLNLYACRKCGAQSFGVAPVLTESGFSKSSPAGLRVLKTTTNAVAVEWEHVNGAVGYSIRLKLPNGKWKDIATVNGETMKYTIKKLSPGTVYAVAVRAITKKGGETINSSYSAVKAQTQLLKANLTNISRTGRGKVKLDWEKTSGADGYRVYVSLSPRSGYKLVKELPSTATGYTIGSLKSGKCYYFVIKAFAKTENGRSYSKASSIKYAVAL